jgi:hypothetical protein
LWLEEDDFDMWFWREKRRGRRNREERWFLM